jgi:SulP family sulfate permease
MGRSTTGLAPKLVAVFRDETYGADRWRRDLVAGLTVAVVALPLSMAIAIASGLGPERGLTTAIIGGFLISALGGSRYQIGGPAGAFIVLVYAVVERHGVDGLMLATLMAGVMMIALGVARAGGLIAYVPSAVTAGFTAGIAVIILASQLREVLGLTLEREPAALVEKLQALAAAIGTLKPMAVVLTAGTIALIVLMRARRPTWPALLLAVAAVSVVSAAAGLDVATIGTRFGGIPSGLPAPSLPDVSAARLVTLLPDAIAIALLGSIESLLSAVVADSMSGDRHEPNTELVAQGAANIAVAVFSGMPVTGTIARTATNVRAAATSPVAGMVHAVALLGFLVLAAPLAVHIPLAALAGVLIMVAVGMVDRHEIATLWRTSHQQRALLVATCVTTIIVDLTAGIAAGLALAGLFKLAAAWAHPRKP